MTSDEWFSGGERVVITLNNPARRFSIFVRTEGRASPLPWLTLLHGFPTCSLDWAEIAGPLAKAHRLLLFDFLGFGDSDKPRAHRYSLHEQAEIVEALWRRFSVARTGLIAHDYGVSVAQELLARQMEGKLSVQMDRAAFLNGGLYAHLHRPLLVQKLLRKPIIGSLLSRLTTEKTFAANFARVFARPLRADEIAEHWRAIARRDGNLIYHRLIHYIDDRHEHHARWEAALEQAPIAKLFLWGMNDPVSGRHVAEQLRARIADLQIEEMEGVGHYPQLEAPESVSRALLKFFAAA